MDFFSIFLFTIFYIVGIGVLGGGILSLTQALAAKKWIIEPGILQDVHLVRRAVSPATYKININYQYQVKGISYEGNNLGFGYTGDSNMNAHSQIYRKLKSAKQAEIRFNPANHSQSTLTSGAHRSHFITISFGVMWLTFTIFLTIFELIAYFHMITSVILGVIFIISLSVFLYFFNQKNSSLLSRLVILE